MWGSSSPALSLVFLCRKEYLAALLKNKINQQQTKLAAFHQECLFYLVLESLERKEIGFFPVKTLQWTSLETNLWALLMTLVILCFNFLFPSCAWVTEKQRQPSLRQTISPWRTMIPPVPGHLRQVHHLSAPQMTHELKHPQCVFVIKPKLVLTVEMARQTVNKKIAWTVGLDSYFLVAAPGSLWDHSEATPVSGPVRCDSCPLPGRDVPQGMEPRVSGTPGPLEYQRHGDRSIACCCVPHFQL